MSNDSQSLIFAVVDDDEQSRKTVVEFLKADEDSWPLDFPDAQSALDFIKENRIDMVISDWEMPGMSGLDLLKALRLNPATAKIPFIMVASQMSNEAIKIADAKAAGADAYLIKPFRRAMLKEKISDVLFERRWNLRRAALVVDDDDEVRKFLADAMVQLSFSPVYEAKNGVEGAACIDEHLQELDVVICDWDMPEMSGIELLRKCRSSSATSRLPFIMATAQTPNEQRKVNLAIESEVDHYLLKPFRIKQLKEKIDLVFSKAKARAQLDHFVANSTRALDSRDFASAERLLNQILELHPNNARALVGLAEVELERVPINLKEAIALLDRASLSEPRWDVPYLRKAAVYEKEIMAVEKAIETLKGAVIASHASAEIHYNLGRLLIKKGRTDLGIDELKLALELNPAHDDARNLLADPSKAKKEK